ncbi:MAG: cytidine deaminase [Anaerolineae bacterium]
MQKSNPKYEQLVTLAAEARERAYAPYSKYKVGAALLGKSGRVYTGCNVEIASYPVGLCAEPVAVAKAVSEGERKFEAIAVVTENGGTPCGACRQFLHEFGNDIEIIVADLSGHRWAYGLEELLPAAFSSEHLI